VDTTVPKEVILFELRPLLNSSGIWENLNRTILDVTNGSRYRTDSAYMDIKIQIHDRTYLLLMETHACHDW
jgi:hypothetical protein